jgi:23S rRNA (adenine2503-C2)-methyltransferase
MMLPAAEDTTMDSLAGYDRRSLASDLASWGESPSHAGRILRHYWRSFGEPDWSPLQITARLRARLEDMGAQPAAEVVRELHSSDGTVKLLLGLPRGGQVEAVMMPSWREGEAAACVSSQVGCAVGCDFCASTRLGLTRNLDVAEIAAQFMRLDAAAAARGRRIRRLVFMGMGEPLHNLDHVAAAIALIADSNMGQLGRPRITISTVGPLRGLRALTEMRLGVQLAVSLHAADDATRQRLIPGAKHTTVAELLDAVRDFERTSKHVINIEYCLLAGINDGDHHAEALADLLAGWRVHVNLIAYNATALSPQGVLYERPAPAVIERFLTRLRDRGIVTHVRYSRGEDVDAACGQLRMQGAGPVVDGRRAEPTASAR